MTLDAPAVPSLPRLRDPIRPGGDIVIRVRPNSVLLDKRQIPGMAEPSFPPGTGNLVVSSTAIQVNGEVTIEQDGAESAAALDLGASVQTASRARLSQPAPGSTARGTLAPRGWALGWIQLQLSEVNWAYYEGKAPKDGSVLLRFDREPARTPGVCRDTSSEGLIWYRGAYDGDKDVSVCELTGQESLPFRMRAVHGDLPSAEFELEVRNRTTNTVNQLVECELHLRFCAVLTLRKPGNGYDFNYQFLKHFDWSTGGRYRVTPPSTAAAPWSARILGRHHGSVSNGADGPPKAPEQAKMLTDPRAPHCLSLASLAPQRVRPVESATRTGSPR